MYRIWLLKLNKWILFVLFCLLLFALPVYAAYVKEPEVEVLTGGGESQNSAHYAVIGTISQSTPLCALSSGYIYSTSYRVYPGHTGSGRAGEPGQICQWKWLRGVSDRWAQGR